MADLDLAELRRLAEAAAPGGWFWHGHPDAAYLNASDPAVVLQLLDRLEAAEARVEEQDEDLGDWRATYDGLRAEHEVVSGLARDMAGAIGYETPGDSWVEKALALRPLLAELAATRDARAAAVPGAVAGEPESTPAAELPIRSYPEFLRRFLPEEAERRRRAGMTPSEVAQEIGREAAAEALAAFTRAADTQEAGDA